jgi:hypothetical protein
MCESSKDDGRMQKAETKERVKYFYDGSGVEGEGNITPVASYRKWAT